MRKRSGSKRSVSKRSKRSSKRKQYGGNVFPQAPPANNPSDTGKNVGLKAMDHSAMNKALSGGKKQNGGGIALCPTSYVNGPNGYGYVPPSGCIGPIPSAQDPGAQEGLIIAAYTKATGIANSTYDNDK